MKFGWHTRLGWCLCATSILALASCGDDGGGGSTGGGSTTAVVDPMTTTTLDASSSSGTPTTSTTTPVDPTTGEPDSSSSSGAPVDPTTTTGDDSSTGGPAAVCGDGQVDGDEQCDDANQNDGDACTNACTLAVCGDGVVGPGEACDDANQDNTDECTNACGPASCGDGVVQPATEECDDGDMDDTDECINSCKLATCGDGAVQAGAEECDDANADDTDMCVSGCALAECGDGFVLAGTEDCDDANMSNLDACTAACKTSACDDAIQSGDESDVDCGGSCTDCPLSSKCVKGSDCGSGLCGAGVCKLAASCQQIKTADPMAADGVYPLDPDGMGPGPQISAFCDMKTDGGGWQMVFKLSSGVAGDGNNLWFGAAQNEGDASVLNVAKSDKHYVSSFIANYWNKGGVIVTDVRTHVYKNGEIKKFWKYDGATTNSTNWFTNARLTASSYVDLPAGPFNYYAIAGDAANGRRFFISRNYGGCPADGGWLIVDSAADPCVWETNMGAAPLRILYAPGVSFVVWQSAADNNQAGIADVFAVFVR